MPTNQTVQTIESATITIMGKAYPAQNVKVEKLGQVVIKPLSGENPEHPARYQLHATLAGNPNMEEIVGMELPRVDLSDHITGEKHVLSQAIVKYCKDNEIKITSTHFK